MGPLLALAVESIWTPQAILGTIFGGAAGIAVIGVIGAYFLRGIWAKFGEATIEGVVVKWSIHPDRTKEQRAFVKDVIDNEIRRDDGLIAKEIRQQVDQMETRLIEAIEGLRIDREFKDNVLRELGDIQGTLRVLAQGTKPDSDPPPPPPALERHEATLTGRHKASKG
jgi:hypothetical protein